MRVVGFLNQAPVIRKILAHIGRRFDPLKLPAGRRRFSTTSPRPVPGLRTAVRRPVPDLFSPPFRLDVRGARDFGLNTIRSGVY
jgi:hypothetical protein